MTADNVKQTYIPISCIVDSIGHTTVEAMPIYGVGCIVRTSLTSIRGDKASESSVFIPNVALKYVPNGINIVKYEPDKPDDYYVWEYQ